MKVIYAIWEKQQDRLYIGSTKNFSKRKTTHLSQLKNNSHHNILLQRIYNKYGEDNLEFIILETLGEQDDLFEKERVYITEYSPELNIGSVGGGDNISMHPNKEEIIRKRTITQLDKLSKLSPEEKSKKFGKLGEKNPNWQGGISKFYCKCGKEMSRGANCCSTCLDRTGKNNPFFGKKHTEETKEKLRAAHTGKIPTNARPVIVDDIEYVSATAASKVIGCTASTVLNRCNSKKFPNYNFKE